MNSATRLILLRRAFANTVREFQAQEPEQGDETYRCLREIARELLEVAQEVLAALRGPGRRGGEAGDCAAEQAAVHALTEDILTFAARLERRPTSRDTSSDLSA
jgi:hypothetical protein